MAFSVIGGGGGRGGRLAHATLAEINVTPLVDVMLVLLVIFMIASSLETQRLSREAETLRQVSAQEQRDDQPAVDENKVPIDLPKATADVMRAGDKKGKPTIHFDARRRIYFGSELLVDCKAYPSLDTCLDGFEKRLQTHPAAQQVRDVHLRADRHLSYGTVLALMARMRRSGMRSFGLITEPPATRKTGTRPVPKAP